MMVFMYIIISIFISSFWAAMPNKLISITANKLSGGMGKVAQYFVDARHTIKIALR
jgi:hypothetical protein